MKPILILFAYDESTFADCLAIAKRRRCVVILNIDSGPSRAVTDTWLKFIEKLRATGNAILYGYIDLLDPKSRIKTSAQILDEQRLWMAANINAWWLDDCLVARGDIKRLVQGLKGRFMLNPGCSLGKADQWMTTVGLVCDFEDPGQPKSPLKEIVISVTTPQTFAADHAAVLALKPRYYGFGLQGSKIYQTPFPKGMLATLSQPL